MTNEEKASELAQYYSQESDYKRTVGYDCAIAMAEWKENQIIEKACEWLEDMAYYYAHWAYNVDTYEKEIDYDTEKLIEDFKQAMEGGEE